MPEARRSREAAGWLALVGLLVLPALIWPQGAVLAWLAQTAALVVLALSYNLLLGSTGLLSFCHAAFAGLGAFVAAHAFNRFGFALPWLPLAGGLGGAGFGLLFGAIATRRAGTAFAMITLGLGELIAAAAWSVPDWFGGAGGLAIDRTAGAPFGAWRFGDDREAYALIAAWCLLSALAMRVVLATPFARLARAVRDKPRRVAALGTDPRRVRLLMMVIAAFFAGVAGTLTLIDVELASSDSVSMLRSATVLFATVIGGSGGFFGPVLGAAVMAAFGSFVAGLSRAWLFFLSACCSWRWWWPRRAACWARWPRRRRPGAAPAGKRGCASCPGWRPGWWRCWRSCSASSSATRCSSATARAGCGSPASVFGNSMRARRRAG